MAGKSGKKIYNNNYKFIKNLKTVYYAIFICTLVLRYKLLGFYLVNIIPITIIGIFFKVDSLTDSGIDLTQSDSFKSTPYEYLMDFLYLSCLGNLGYFFFKNSSLWILVITISLLYVGYKLFLLKEKYYPSKNKPVTPGSNNTSTGTNGEELSKRQQKLQKKQKKYQYR